MRNQIDSNGFNLPSAYKSHDNSLNHKIVIAALFASVSVAAIVGAQIVGLL
ncbi:hypothetical protein ACFQ3K_03535 [Brucella gallinifaecis]|uniref:hypothetical protein n=1 Tax=Brucella gallinifaecis TaxID=215590 RepID=UPI00130E1090|nr:hypothetical protein [Brucella gallinifaecis]